MISGILHVLKVGCRWCDCPAGYGPSTTIYNRFNRRSNRGFWLKLLDALVGAGAALGANGGAQRKRSAARAAVGRPRFTRSPTSSATPYVLMLTARNVSDIKAPPAPLERAGRMRYLLADKGYDADRLRRSLRDAGAVPVIPGRRNRKRAIPYD